MGAVIALAAAAARRRLRTLAAIGAAMGICTFLAGLAFLLYAGNRGPAAAMMAKAAAPDLLLVGDDRLLPTDEAAAWWRGRLEVAAVVRYPAVLDLESNPRLNDQPMHNLSFLLTEAVARDRKIDLMLAVPGSIVATAAAAEVFPAVPGGGAFPAAPNRGEIWITLAVARAYGAKIGDTITVTTTRGETGLTVSAVVIDPLFNPGMMNPRRAWVAPGFLAERMAASALGSYALAVAFKDADGGRDRPLALDAAWREFTETFGYSGISLFKRDIEAGYGFLGSILAAVLSFLSLIAFLGGIAVLQSTISASVRSDFKLVGIYQTLGLPPARIAAVFLLQFAPALIVFAAAGAAAAPLGYGLIARAGLEATGAAAPDINVAGLALLAGGIALLGCAAAAAVSAIRAGSVRTADALRLGEAAPRPRAKAVTSPLSSLIPLWAALGLRHARLGLARAAAAALATFFAAFAAYAAVASLGAMSDLSRKPDFFGNAESQVILLRNGKRFKVEHERLAAELAADPTVLSFLASGYLEASLPAPDGGAVRTIYGQTFDGDLDGAGFHTIEGRNPAAAFEAAAAASTARDYGLTPGSELAVRIQGIPIVLKIVGIYQSMNNLGQGLRFSGATPRSLTPDYAPLQYDVFLNAAETPETFAKRLEARFGEGVDAQLTADRAGAFVDSILSGMYGAVAVAAALFLATAALAAAGATAADTRENARGYAVFNLIGLERKEIAMAVATKAFIVALAASIAGTALGVFLSPTILHALIRNLGLVRMPFFLDVPAAVVIAAVVAIWSGLAAWLTAVLTLRADARLLVTE